LRNIEIFIKVATTLGELQFSFGKIAPPNSSIIPIVCCSKSGKLGIACYINK